MPDFLFVMQINGAVNEPKVNDCDSIEVRNVAANGEIFICVSFKRLSINSSHTIYSHFYKKFSRRPRDKKNS